MSEPATTDPGPAPAPSAEPGRPPWHTYAAVALLAALVFLAFHDFLSWVVERWWHDEYYGHGLLIPPLSAYLIYRQWPRLAALGGGGYGKGLWLMAGGLLLHIAAIYYGANFASGFALIAVLYGLVIWLLGWPRARALAFAFAFLGFAVPLTRGLVDQFAQPMQVFSAHGAADLASVFGIPNQVDGVSIITRDYTFKVAIPCSGLKSAIAMSALGALVAYMLEGPLWKRGLLFALSLPVALAANLLRIFITVILGNSLGPAAAEGFFHTASGALVFILAFVGLLLVGGALGCRQMREDF